MTQDKAFKKAVRARQRDTGKRYTQARSDLTSKPPPVQPDARIGREGPGRIIGLETKYLAHYAGDQWRPLGDGEVARYLFRRIVAWGRSSNVYLENGANLRLDPESLPDYATPECDSPRAVVIHEAAGGRFLAQLAKRATSRLREEGLDGKVTVRKAASLALTGAAPSHENYLISSRADFQRYASLIPFFVTRQCFSGSGGILSTSGGPVYCLSPRAEDLWQATTGATGAGAMLTTHVPPLADPDKYRRLHVTVGDSNMSELATFVKVASTLILLHMVDSGAPLPDVALEDPIGALREFSHDPDLRRTARLNDGQRLSALEIQLHYQAHAERYGDSDGLQQDLRDGFALWSRMLRQLESDPSVMHREVDWVLKRKLIEERRASANLGLGDPEISSLAADYSEVGEDGIYGQLRTNGGVDTLNADDEISRAIDQAPEGTRANLRARFIRDSRAASCNYAVDWTHLKLTDGPKRTIVCKEPALATDERVERLLARYVNASQGDR